MREWTVAGLEEDRAWRELRTSCAALGQLTQNAEEIFGYAFTELVNNAIDHSMGSVVRAEVDETSPGILMLVISDDGEGVFAHLCRLRGYADDLEALHQLEKGKVTTDPARHTGQGIFFSSKAVDRFDLESGRLRWTVDNVRGDVAVALIEPPARGTRITFRLRRDTPRRLKEVFDAYTDEALEFSRTRTHVKLFELGLAFVSRSEAKRLAAGLERFSEALIDFAGVSGVGQGFADELFRVWAAAHPGTRLMPVNMNPAVEFMVRRALAATPAR